MNDFQKSLKDMAVVIISREAELTEHKINETVDQVHCLPMFSMLTKAETDEIKNELKAEFSIKLDKGVLIEEKGHEKWFLARKASLDMKYWERYKKYLLMDSGFPAGVVNTMDDVLDTLTDLLGDPTRDVAYGRRGLIIGDVQSGKTANYTGLICKAVDSGYKVVVLLTGTIEKLRQQTQQRIDEGFVGCDSDAMMKQKDDKLIIGVGKYDSSIRPMVLTSTTDDFKQQNAQNLNFDLRNINGPVIFVVKKNTAVLGRLNKWLKKFNQNGNQKINHSLLVIDDESDNASVNTRKEEDSPTAINSKIRDLLNSFAKSSYVGFTATPYANIFIDPDSFDDMVAEDLFPKDYIYSLNAPSNYIGARNIFSETGAFRNMLVEINSDKEDPESISSILPLKHKSSIQVRKLPRDLEEAVAAFMIANVVEDLRGMNTRHRSMLVNVSRFTAVQEQVSVLVNDFLKNLQNSCRLYGKLAPEKALTDPYMLLLKTVYEELYGNLSYSWEEIQGNLHGSCAGIVVQTINQRNGKNLSFEIYKKTGLRLIAVGGMSLSRGLTLEGLVISYFFRNSKMYDTLMQMGRWFGYRKGYDDLCRIWMTEDSIQWYSYISEATDELRDEVKRYEDTGLTPMDFGLRVRSDMASLIVTAHNKMRSAESRECVISLSGVCIETPEIYSDRNKNIRNFENVVRLVDSLYQDGYVKFDGGKQENTKWGFENVPVRRITDFLESMDISPKNEQFNTRALNSFIKGYRGNELKKWDIAFATGTSDTPVDFGYGIKYSGPVRSYSVENNGRILKMSGSNRRLGTSSDGTFNLGEGTIEEIKSRLGKKNPSQKDYFINVDRNPLMTVYAVQLAGAKKNHDGELLEWHAEPGDFFIGIGIGIPALADQETKYAKYILNKIAIQQIFEGDYDEMDSDAEDDED